MADTYHRRLVASRSAYRAQELYVIGLNAPALTRPALPYPIPLSPTMLLARKQRGYPRCF